MRCRHEKRPKACPACHAQGEHVVGLRFRPYDKRWVVVATGQIFSADNEESAIKKFRNLTDAPESETDVVDRLMPQLKRNEKVWLKHVAEQIRIRPNWVAEQTGIEQIAYINDLKPPQPLPTFDDIKKVWNEHFKRSAEQKRRVIHAWNDFVKTARVSGLKDVTPEAVVAYRDAVYARNLTGKMQSNIFTRIRRLLTFARSRAIAVKAISEAVENLKLLIPSETSVSLDPKPIERKDFQKLLESAEGDDKAMILLMLNAALYLQEVIRIKWTEIKDGCLVTHRMKEGRIVRIAVLWEETRDALKSLKARGEHLFYAYHGKPIGSKGAELRFRNLRDKAKVSVTSSQLRDGAATVAAEANVNEPILNLLLGHRSGINDHYVKRNPRMVAPACEAVRNKYLS